MAQGGEATGARYRVREVAHGIWAIDEGFVQCFLVEGSERAVLIDSCASGGEEFARTVCGLTSKPITLVITHSDPDHTAGQTAFLPAFMHPAEFARYVAKGSAPTQTRALWEAETIELGGLTLEVILLPGHTPGSIALLDRANRRLFVGDTVSDWTVYLYGEGRSLPAYLESLKKLEKLASSIDNIHPAHGTPTLPPEWIARTRIATEKLLAGELPASDPPDQQPCKLYAHDGVNLLYSPQP